MINMNTDRSPNIELVFSLVILWSFFYMGNKFIVPLLDTNVDPLRQGIYPQIEYTGKRNLPNLKAVEESWKFVHCTPTTIDCGRLE